MILTKDRTQAIKLGDAPPASPKPATFREHSATWATGITGMLKSFYSGAWTFEGSQSVWVGEPLGNIQVIGNPGQAMLIVRSGGTIELVRNVGQPLDPRGLSNTYGAESNDPSVDDEQERFERINTRRRFLIDKEYLEGRLSPEDEQELQQLQEQAAQYVNALRPERKQALEALRERLRTHP